ncbi:Fic family protein [Actinophytocola oryzae]|uniref:Fic family protein n=1 Tax=Actinophytocola oryzae TaxID=502181 RepID=A0A4R7VYH9_9PSEU|nr:Fic family protein [Actinophytocola oryzae]
MAAAAEQKLGRLDVVTQHMPVRKHWVEQTMRREALASARLDEWLITVREAYALDLKQPAQDRDTPLRGYLRSGIAVVKAAKRGRPLDVDLMGRLSSVTTGGRGDEPLPWRTTTAWLGGSSPAAAYLIVAPPGAELRVGTEQWCSWVREQKEMPLIVKITAALLQFMLLSPFPRSGHLARLAVTHELLRTRTLSAPVLPLSEWLHRHQDELPRIVRGVVESHDLDTAVSFVAACVSEVCEVEIARIESARRQSAEVLRKFTRRTAVVRAIQALYAKPMMGLSEIESVCKVSDSQAAKVIRQLQEAGVVEPLDMASFRQHTTDTPYRKTVFVPSIMRVLGLWPLP